MKKTQKFTTEAGHSVYFPKSESLQLVGCLVITGDLCEKIFGSGLVRYFAKFQQLLRVRLAASKEALAVSKLEACASD